MLKVYAINELAEKEKITRQAITHRIKQGGHYIPVRIDSAQYAKTKKGFTVRYIIRSDLKDYLFQ